MRRFLPWLLILLAVGLGYWLFAGDGSDDDLGYDIDDGLGAAQTTQAGALELKAAEKAPGDAKRGKPTTVWQAPDPRTLPTGALYVQPLGPDLKPLIDPRLTVHVNSTSRRGPYLGLMDEVSGAWHFPKVIAGPVTVTVRGDHVVGRTLPAVVRRGQDNTFEVHLELAGAVRYEVVTYAKTHPEQVLVELFDAGGRPAEAWFQVRSSRSMTQPQRKKAHTQRAKGILFGLRPGRYKVKVTNIDTDEWDDGEVTIEAGKTAELALTVRR